MKYKVNILGKENGKDLNEIFFEVLQKELQKFKCSSFKTGKIC